MSERRGRGSSFAFLVARISKKNGNQQSFQLHVNLGHLVHAFNDYPLELDSALLKSHRILQRYSTWEIRFLILYIEADEVKIINALLDLHEKNKESPVPSVSRNVIPFMVLSFILTDNFKRLYMYMYVLVSHNSTRH